MIFSLNFQDIIAILSTFTALMAIFNSFVVRPLREALYALRDEMKDLSKEIAISREDRRKLEVRITEIDERVKSAHKRLDSLERGK